MRDPHDNTVRGCGIDAVVIGNSVFIYDEGMISCYIEFRRKTGEETKPIVGNLRDFPMDRKYPFSTVAPEQSPSTW